jgi:hypothetical protein
MKPSFLVSDHHHVQRRISRAVVSTNRNHIVHVGGINRSHIAVVAIGAGAAYRRRQRRVQAQ